MNAPMRVDAAQTAHYVPFILPAEFIEELRRDHAAGCIRDNIVRLALKESVCTVAMTEPARSWDDRALPASVARSRYVEAAYISTRAQLVKISRFCGFVWTSPTDGGLHNDAVAKRQSSEARRLQAVLATLKGIEVRGGGLYVDDGTEWTAFPDEMIASPPTLVCRDCGEAVHFSNGAWRHTATNRDEAVREVLCFTCVGSGKSRTGNVCLACTGSGKGHEVDHIAAVADEVPV